jgi:hypothetical protein
MTLTGGVRFGLKAVRSNLSTVSDVVVTGNEQWGMIFNDSGQMRVWRGEVSGNGFGDFGVGGGVNAIGARVSLLGVAIESNTGNGAPGQRRAEVQVLTGARIYINRGTISAVTLGSDFEAAGDWALFADGDPYVQVRRTAMQGAFYLDDDARAEFEQVTQSVSSGNVVSGNSSLRGKDGSVLAGTTTLTEFSNATFEGGSDVGTLDCADPSADALCDGSVTGTSNCPLCSP